MAERVRGLCAHAGGLHLAARGAAVLEFARAGGHAGGGAGVGASGAKGPEADHHLEPCGGVVVEAETAPGVGRLRSCGSHRVHPHYAFVLRSASQ